ncbi:hypothetical protein PR048_020480 [Dryococelus australis]|uniref:Uncharacterized protein n=1 Tax=Dryococelus australis TaxID=614101 RepID=A0ABQ9H6T7_9NEOP|nr:hypothetical protein PR048_020480 [Dryococelus australis]
MAASHNFIHSGFIETAEIRPIQQAVQLATHQHTGELNAEVTVTARIRDIITSTTAYVSDDISEGVILEIPAPTGGDMPAVALDDLDHVVSPEHCEAIQRLLNERRDIAEMLEEGVIKPSERAATLLLCCITPPA